MKHLFPRTFALSLIATCLSATGALALEREPVACTEGFVVQDDPGSLFDGDTFQPLAGFDLNSPGIEFNNLGWRSTDRQLYALELTGFGNNGLVRIDGDWDFEFYGPLLGLPNRRFDAGEISTDGTRMYISIGSDDLHPRIYVVDLTPVDSGGVPVLIEDKEIFGDQGRVHDWAYLPGASTNSAMLFGGDSIEGQLAVLSRDNGTWTRFDFDVAGLPSDIAFGGARFNSAGNLVLYRNRVEGDDNHGRAYEIDVNTMTIVSDSVSRGTFFNDATSCQQAPVCDQAYFVQDIGASLFQTNTASGSFTQVTTMCSSFTLTNSLEPLSAAVEFNNMCYRKQDGKLYALELFKGPGGNAHQGGNKGLVRIDPETCEVERLGEPAGLPTAGILARFDAGDCTQDGEVMFVNNAGIQNQFFAVDLATMTASPVTIEKKRPTSNIAGHVHDWARSPVDGKLYGGDNTEGHLASIEMVQDPNTGAWTGYREDRNLVPTCSLANCALPQGDNQFGAYGGAWFNADGLVVLHRNDGEIFEINVATRELVSKSAARSSGYNDAASCIP